MAALLKHVDLRSHEPPAALAVRPHLTALWRLGADGRCDWAP